MFKYICLTFFLLSFSTKTLPCNKVVFGDLDWDSSRFHVEVASFILENGLDCETDKIPGTTMPLLTALGKGDIHVLMEVWKQNLEDAWENSNPVEKPLTLELIFLMRSRAGLFQGYLKDKYPNLKRVEDLPKFKKLFDDPETPGKGRFYNCILGWSCEDVNTKNSKHINYLMTLLTSGQVLEQLSLQ